MPRNVSEIRIVVASPNDVLPERDTIFDTIEELNRVYESRGLSVRGLGWEEYATPGVDRDVQTLIGKQILQDYDILIALFWTKLGTPTANSRSGTIEEIEHAFKNTKSAFSEYRLQVYFKDRIDSLSSVTSPSTLIDVLKFREELRSRGVLYKIFANMDELERLVRTNIQRAIERFLQDGATASTQDLIPASQISSEDEPGILDMLEEAEASINTANISVQDLGNLMVEIAKETSTRTETLESISATASTSEKKTIVNQFADFLKLKATEIKHRALIARSNFRTFITITITLLNLGRTELKKDDYKSQLDPILDAAENLLKTIPETRESFVRLREAISTLPRITIQFNQAKRQLLEALDDCVALVDETETAVFDLTSKT